MLRHILCAIAPDASADGPRTAAVQFGAGYGATVSGLFVRKLAPPPYPPMGDPMTPAFPSEQMLRSYEEEVRAHETAQDDSERAATARFDEACMAGRVTGRMFTRSGNPAEEIVAGAKFADLVVAGRGQREDSTLGSVSGWLVRHLSRPVMLVDEPTDGLSRIAVAYDGSSGAERALALVADIASAWKGPAIEVYLLHAAHVPVEEVARAERYLDIYGVRHRAHAVAGRAADGIVELAERHDVDLLAMGAYGHSLLREVVLGSTTQEVVARWRRPLLLWR